MSLNPTADDTGAVYRTAWGKGNVNTVTQEERERRNEDAKEIANAYYDLINDNYEEGWGRKFHFCRYQHGESIEAGLARHEHYMALMTEMRPGMKILDVGCGVGGPARSIASFTGAYVTGITINKVQVARAKLYSEEEGLSDRVNFIEGDWMKMPFPDNTFDRIYAMEATCYATSLEQVYTEIHRVLKPGGVFGTYEWLITPKYEDKNQKHREVRNRIERGAGVPKLVDSKHAVKALKKAGFEVVKEEDLAITTSIDPVPWWYPLDGDLTYTTHGRDKFKVFMMKKCVHLFMLALFWVLELLRIAPKGRNEAIKTVGMCVYSMRDGGRLGIFTPLHMFIAKKPKKHDEKTVQ